jgi:hypothetical protein
VFLVKSFLNKSNFKYYLERHIEIDGDHHSHLALKMIKNLCAESELRWQQAEEAVIETLQKRTELWDAVLAEIMASKLHKNEIQPIAYPAERL